LLPLVTDLDAFATKADVHELELAVGEKYNYLLSSPLLEKHRALRVCAAALGRRGRSSKCCQRYVEARSCRGEVEPQRRSVTLGSNQDKLGSHKKFFQTITLRIKAFFKILAKHSAQ